MTQGRRRRSEIEVDGRRGVVAVERGRERERESERSGREAERGGERERESGRDMMINSLDDDPALQFYRPGPSQSHVP